ncbi:MAG: type II secretion system protein [Candidatus Paceibacterota bacterium]
MLENSTQQKISHTTNLAPQSKKWCRGFTLVELIVSLGLFTAVALISIGALLSVVSANKKVQSLRVVMDNLNFSVESMARSMRVGSSYQCGGINAIPNDCGELGSDIVSFKDINGSVVVYRLHDSSIQRSTDGGLSYLDMTSPEITIEKLRFFVRGALKGDQRQPRVLFITEGVAGVKDLEQAEFNLQTTISQRPLDT